MIRIFAALLLVVSLSGCDLHEGTKMSQNRLQLEQTDVVQKFAAAELDQDAIAMLARDYGRSGGDDMDLTVIYDPASRTNTAMHASNEVARILGVFRKQGITTIVSNILPVNGQGDEALVLMTYTSYSAHAPKDCDVMPGMEDTDIEANPDYKLGCSIETVFAKQIARPKDLVGQTLNGVTDGRGSANVIDAHRTGAQQEPLGGETASE